MTLDPRTRLLSGLALLTVIPLLVRLESLAGVTLTLLVAIAIRQRPAGLTTALRLGLPLTAMVFAVTALWFDVATAVPAALRLFGLLLAAAALFQGLSPEEFADGLGLLKVPYPLVFLVTTSLRYVPLVSRKLKRIREAQRCRGIDLRWRPSNLKNLAALLLPLLVQSFLLAEHLALAMEARGFARQGRSRRRSYRIAARDYALLGFLLAALGGLLWWDRSQPS